MKIPLFDAHCDTAFRMILEGGELFENSLHTDLKRGLQYTPYAQFYALFAMDEEKMPISFHKLKGKSADEIFRLEFDLLFSELKKNTDWITICKNAKDAEMAHENGKAAAFISIEGAELFGCDIQRLEELYEHGVRALILCWNNLNALCCEKGLTELGERFVNRCNELGIIIDVSHLRDESFWDVIRLSKLPVIASHSNSRAICLHKRNLTDEQFQAIIKCRGVAGINMYEHFLGENPDINTIIRHIDHFLSLGGAENIAFGCDFDGCDTLCDGFNGIENMKNVYNALLRQNYPEKLLNDIFFNNLMRVVGEVCDI